MEMAFHLLLRIIRTQRERTSEEERAEFCFVVAFEKKIAKNSFENSFLMRKEKRNSSSSLSRLLFFFFVKNRRRLTEEEELNSITIPHHHRRTEEEEEEERGEKNTSTTLLSNSKQSSSSLSSPTSSSQSNSMSNKRGGPAEPPSFLQEVAFLAVSALFSCLVLSFGLKRLDPNRQTSKAAEQRKKEIAKRLGRPKLVTNVYEDAIAADVANPDHINVTFNSIGGLEDTKEALQELVILPLVRPELFSKSNLLKPAKGVLLYGPPGTGKTLLAKALAKESQACFINVRTSTLQSKWFGDAQKLVTAVFTLAWKLQPSIIFIDEIDSFLGTRKNSEHEAVTQMKTEFMTLWDGFNTDSNARVMVLAATNRPWDVDEAILRRLPRSFEVGLPNKEQRAKILGVTLQHEKLEKGFFLNEMNAPIWQIAERTKGYSGSDLQELCKQAAYGPVRDLLRSETRGENTGGGCRALMMKDFDEILKTSNTSAQAASSYQYADEMRKNTRSANAREGYQDPEEIEKAQLMMQQMMAGLFQAAQNESSRSGSPSSQPKELD
jgi:SpoVK/Ycf46/Vps4 family AAA+-type ATPase